MLFSFSFTILIYFLLFQIKKTNSQDFKNLSPKLLEEDSEILDLKDYDNVNAIITKKSYYYGLYPELKVTFETELPSSAVFASYTSDYIIGACTNNNLLASFDVNTFTEVSIYDYSEFSNLETTNSTCSISVLSPYGFVVYTTIQDSILNLFVLRIKLKIEDGAVKVDDSPSYFRTNMTLIDSEEYRYISCESILARNNVGINYASLLCGYITYDQTSSKYSYRANTAYFNFSPCKFNLEKEKVILESADLYHFQIHNKNSTSSRFLIGEQSYEIYQVFEGSYFAIYPVTSGENTYLSSFRSNKGLFYCNNEYIFHAYTANNINYNIYITNNVSNNNSILTIYDKKIKKIWGHYDTSSDKFIFVYQYTYSSSVKIDYIVFEYNCFSNAWHIDSNNYAVCYNENHCQSYQYYYNSDTRECTLSYCYDYYYQFNYQCYKTACPEGTTEKSAYTCESDYDYCYIDVDFTTHCDSSALTEYTYQYKDTKIYLKNCLNSTYLLGVDTFLYNGKCVTGCNSASNYSTVDTKECFDDKQSCIDKGYKIFKLLCVNSCPENSIEGTDNNCECQYKYYTNNTYLICGSESNSCEDIGYPIISNTNQCFLSQEECIQKGNKFFNNTCFINNCPTNTEEKNNDGICYCSYYFYKDYNTNLYSCFDNEDTCESKGYYNKEDDTESKQCFINIDDCILNGLKIFNNKCYSSCPENTKINEDNNNYCICENYFFYLNDEYNCFSSDKICITANAEYKYTNNLTKECFLTKNDCIQKGQSEYCKYYEDCDPSEDYMFNDICYKDGCPEGTKLDTSVTTSKICIPEVITEIVTTINIVTDSPIKSTNINNDITYKETTNNEINHDTIHETNSQIITETSSNTIKDEVITNSFNEINPPSSSLLSDIIRPNPKECPYVYKGNCVSQCPENTCLDPNTVELYKCIDLTENMKIYNNICIPGINQMITDLTQNDNLDNIEPITTPSGTTVNIIPAEGSKEDYIKKYPKLTMVDLGKCGDKLKDIYKQDLYVLGIDSPNIYGNSSINIFNYEIYLKNGTQIKDINTICKDDKITTSSSINDLNSVKFDKAVEFNKNGYDIYNKFDKFYVDNCAPANDNGNDITLEDRATYYYPNISICNEGCDYNSINYDSQRFVCECDINNISISSVESNINNNNTNKDDETYLEYFLSLINYKIVKCFELFNEFTSFYYNAGFYIGFSTLLISIIIIFVFCIKTTKTIKLTLFKNLPTNEKLKEEIRLNNNRKISMIKNDIKNNNNNSNPPPHKNKNKKNKKSRNTINVLVLGDLKNNKDIIKKQKKSKNMKNKSVKVFNKNLKIKEKEKEESNSIMKLESPKLLLKNKKKPIQNLSLKKPQKSSSKINNYSLKTNNNHDDNDNNDELKLDLNFSHLLILNDDEIDKKELNEIPYRQALRLENRNFFEITIAVLINKIGLLNLFCYRSPYTHLSLNVTVYLFELLLDLTMNCILYSDDVVSEKYHNDGSLSWFTSFSLSIISNIISSIITSLISNLADYSELFEMIVSSVKNRKKYLANVIRFMKYIRIRLTCFFILQLIFTSFMTYYLFIFCTVYHNTQGSIMVNYIIGALTSLAYSAGLTIIISILRLLSIKCHSFELYNTSRYLYKKL